MRNWSMRWSWPLLLLLLSACMPPAIREQESIAATLRASPDIVEAELEHADGTLHYASSGIALSETTAVIVFIHGTPGGWENAGRYLLDETLQAKASLISFDRPGWGRSTTTSNSEMFTVQSQHIAQLLEHLTAQASPTRRPRVILAGHSLGASIAPRVAMDYPQSVDGLLLMSGSLNPALGGPRWYNRLAAIPGAYCVLPQVLVDSNREIIALRANLDAMQPLWSTLTMPITVMHGMRDALVFPANIDFAEQNIAAANARFVRLPDAGHLVNLEHRDRVRQELIKLLEPHN